MGELDLDVGLRHERAPAGDAHDEAGVLGQLQRLPDRGPAHAVADAELPLARNLLVGQPVPAADEPSWIALQANGVPLFGARTQGADQAPAPPLSVTDAITALSGGAAPATPR